jgi:hypothetical protein
VTEIHTAPPQRNLESFERAFNAILIPGPVRDPASTEAALASALGVELDDARSFIAAYKPVPLARCQTEQEAELIVSLVQNCGLRATVIADEDLKVETALARARRLTMSGDTLEIHHVSGVLTIPRSEVKIIVLGALRNIRVEYTEALTGGVSRKESVLDTAEFLSEETLLDVYSSSLAESFRIKADAFDYSSFVEKLAFRAEENFQAVLKGLCEASPQAVLDADFARVRGLLSRAWPQRSQTEAQGIKRAGASYRPVAKSSVVSNNRDQFERYSRLMFLMGSR